MTTPFAHAHVSHVSKTARRRSKSLTIVDSDEEDAPERNIHRKLFLAQLQKERQKQHNNRDGQHKEQLEDQDEEQQDNENHHHSVVTRVAGGNSTQLSRKKTTSTAANSVLMKKQMSLTTSAAEEDEQRQPTIIRGAGTNNTQVAKQPTSVITANSGLMKKQMSTTPTTVDEDEQHEPAVIRVARGPTTMSMKQNTPLTAANSTTSKKAVSSMSSDSKYSEENEQNYGHQSQIIRIPQSESTMSIRKQASTKSNQNGNVNSFTYNNSNLGSSHISSNPYQSSSINLISKSEIFDQDFHLDDSKDHAKRNDAKNRGKVSISGRAKHYGNYDRKLYARSSASFMIAIIGITIAIIAFALGLTALVLVLLLRVTVANELGTNSSSNSLSSGNGSWLYACSAYTTIDDPTRNVKAAGYALGCDNSAPFSNRTTPVWIRFIGTGGTTLPLATPGLNLCGSVGTGWYDGSMPLSGNMANGTACFTWSTSVCLYSVSISVVNCGSFYIYLLPPAPACMMRYCTI